MSIQGVTALIVAITSLVTALGTLAAHLQLRSKIGQDKQDG